jgi:hypothetical protein
MIIKFIPLIAFAATCILIGIFKNSKPNTDD